MGKNKKHIVENHKANCYPKKTRDDMDVPESQLSLEHNLYEFDDVDSFLFDYKNAKPAPFTEVKAGTRKKATVSETIVKTRETICKKCCVHPSKGAFKKESTCSEGFLKDFQTGWEIGLTQEQDISACGTTSATPLTMFDVRLNGKPASLRIHRAGLKQSKKRLPVQVIPYVSANVKEQMTLRLMKAVNDAYIDTGNKRKYIAEAYGISTRTIDDHLTLSAIALRNRALYNRRKALWDDQTGALAVRNIRLFPFVLKGKKVIGCFEFPDDRTKGGKLLDIYDCAALDAYKASLVSHFESSQTFSLLSNEQIKGLDLLSTYWLDNRESIDGYPPELLYAVIGLYIEVAKQLNCTKYDFPEQYTQKIHSFFDGLMTPLIQKIFLRNAPIKNEDFTILCRTVSEVDSFFDKGRVLKCVAAILKVQSDWSLDYSSNILLWEERFGKSISKDQENEIKKTVKLLLLHLKNTKGLSSDEVRKRIFLNKATLPSTGDPHILLEQTPFGTIDVSVWDEFGIDLHCLRHMIKGGLFSENLQDIPKCLFYDEGFLCAEKYENEYCRQCRFEAALEAEMNP